MDRALGDLPPDRSEAAGTWRPVARCVSWRRIMTAPLARSRHERPADPPRDAALMERVRRGDREAFARLVERHKDPLVAYLARLTGSPDRAQDLVQEAFLRVFQWAERYRERGQFTAWLYRIATNLVRSEARRERRWSLLTPELAREASAPVEPGAPRSLLRRQMHERLVEALGRLPLDLRAPLVLFEIEGWPQGEIARVLGCREGTVKSRIHRARKRLRDELAPYRDDWQGGLS